MSLGDNWWFVASQRALFDGDHIAQSDAEARGEGWGYFIKCSVATFSTR